LQVVYIVAVHVASLALAVAGAVGAGDRPQVLVYAFVLDFALRLATVFIVIRSLAARGDSLVSRLAPIVCRLPSTGDRSAPLTYEGSPQPVGPAGYLAVTAFLAFLAVVLTNVNPDRQLDLDVRTFADDLRWAFMLAVIYWGQSLLTRTIVVDPSAGWSVNAGYNTRGITILALAVLLAGGVVVARQTMELPASGWVLLGPLFGVRFLFDLFDALGGAIPAQ
jgi:hypothetical protein